MSEHQTEVEKLKSEIIKLKADKEFVWSLWKRLQLSSPDLVDAVTILTQREKNKLSKNQDNLNAIIKSKDQKLAEMQEIIDEKNIEIENLMKKNNEITKRTADIENLCEDLANKATKLNESLINMEENDHREIINNYEQERQKLVDSISGLQNQITILMEQKAELQVQNRKNQDTLNIQEEMQVNINNLCQQLEDANIHIRTQEETITMLRDQLETTAQNVDKIYYEDDYSINNYPDYGKVNSPEPYLEDNDERLSIAPIEDLNYKVDRLSLHMQQLEDCMIKKSNRENLKNSRSRSTPPNKNHRVTQQLFEMTRKIHFLTMKWNKSENLLAEEKKISQSSQSFLDKANNRNKTLQLTVKQLRKQTEDIKFSENEWKKSTERLKADVEMYKKEIKNLEGELQKMCQNSVTDASRIQDLLNNLEKTRDDLMEKMNKQNEEADRENERLKYLVKQLESEKCLLEVQCKGDMVPRCTASMVLANKPSQLCSSARNSRKMNKIMKNRQNGIQKLNSMSNILEHFVNPEMKKVDQIKEDEWEDVDTDDEERISTDVSTMDMSEALPKSDPSAGSLIVRKAKRNIEFGQIKDSLLSRGYNARYNHIKRLMMKTKSDVDLEIKNKMNVTKTRLASLRQQLKSVTSSRDTYKTKLKQVELQMKTMQTELSQTKFRCNRLLETIKIQHHRHQDPLEERRQIFSSDKITHSESPQQQLEQKILLKDSSLEFLDYNSVAQVHHNLYGVMSSGTGGAVECATEKLCRKLQQDLHQRDSDLLQAKEKNTKIEREILCKKRIIENLRNKLVIFEGEKDKENSLLEDKQKRIKELEDQNSRIRTQMDSLQTRINVVLEERRRFEMETASLINKLDCANTKLNEMRLTKQSLESRLNRIDEGHELQIGDLMRQTSSALEKAAIQIRNITSKNEKYETIIINLAKDFYQKVIEIRRLVQFGHKRFSERNNSFESNRKSPPESVTDCNEFARNKAANILNLSRSEIDSLVQGISEPISDRRQTGPKRQRNNSAHDECSQFTDKCLQALKNNSFDRIVPALFADKLDELMELVAPMSPDSGCVSSS